MKLLRSPRYILVIFLCSIFSIQLNAQAREYPSLLWEISGNGLTKPSYLYGTMHVSKKVAFHLTDAFFDGLKSTEVVALETNPETWLAELMEEGLSMSRSSLYRGLFSNGGGFYGKAFDFSIPRNKYIQSQIAREPENVNSLLYRFNGRAENFEEYTYLDLFIFQSAKKSSKKVVALEDFKTSMEMLMKSSLPDDDKDKTPVKRKQVPYNIGELIEDAYRNGNLDALDSLNKVSYTSKNFEKYMLIDRNVIMANHMDSIMKKQSLFTAIGAAHLPGNAGVISLLRKMGYTVKPVKSEVSKKSIHTMDDFEDMHTGLTFSTQFAVDSAFKVDVPGRLFPMTGLDQKMDTYLYTDMVNGSYYMVKRIRNYGVLLGQDQAYQARRIDSLLYESIPGKILRKEPIKASNGDPGFNIVNKTRRGDVQRYNIFMSDKYIYIFKVAGNGDYVQKSDADRFFKSITFENKAGKTGWTTYAPATGGYELALPNGYSLIKGSGSEFQKERITASTGADYYMFNRSVMNDYAYIEEDTFELSQLAKNFYESLDFQLQDKQFGTHQSFPCIDVTAKKKNSDNFLHLKIVMKDQQYFLLACATAKKEKPESFLGSLKFKDFRYEKMETYSDTSLYFSVKTDYHEPKKSTIESISDPLKYYYSKMKKTGAYEHWQRSKTIESPLSAEAVQVELMKASDYRSDESADILWKEWTDYYTKDLSMLIRSKKRFDQNNMPVMDLVLGDTNSIKQILVRLIINKGVMYTLSATIDSVSGGSAWVKTFYDTFRPKDTLIGRSTFEDKVPEFFKDVVAKDSATREKVNAIGGSIKFRDKHAGQLMQFIAGPDFNNISLFLKNDLIRDLGRLKDPAIAAFLKKEYPKYVDSASIQISLLRALADQKTTEATTVFLQSLLVESPLSNIEDDVNSIFYPFYDSLKLAPALYPQLLQITRYAEYKPAVYGLMSTLLDSSLVKPAIYEASKKEILREASDELKRQITAEDSNTGSGNDDDGSDYSNEFKGDDELSRAMAAAYAAAKEAAQDAADEYTASGPSMLLQDYCNLLAPFYADPSVKTFFGKAFKTKSTDFKIHLVTVMLKNNQPAPDGMIDSLSKDLKTRVELYTALDKLHKAAQMKPEYRSRESLLKAKLFAFKKDLADSSIQFITSRYVVSKAGSGLVYFYTTTNKDGDKMLYYYGSQPKDETCFSARGVKRTLALDDGENVNEKIDKICYDLSLKGRKRVKSYYSNNEDYSFGDF